MEKIDLNKDFGFCHNTQDKWIITSHLLTALKLNHNGIKFAIHKDEFKSIKFDMENKIVEAEVSCNILPIHVPKRIDLSETTETFVYLHDNISDILKKGCDITVEPNEDKTIFSLVV